MKNKELKYCNKCNIALPLSDFPKGKNTCKACKKIYNKAYNTNEAQPKKEKRIVSQFESKQGKVITGIKRNPILYWDCLNYTSTRAYIPKITKAPYRMKNELVEIKKLIFKN